VQTGGATESRGNIARMNWFAEGLTYVLSTVGALLPIVNPLSAVGLVASITANLTEQERKEQIKRACIYMFFILTAFLVAGGLIMNFFGISIPGLRIAGGMILSYLGFRMLFPETPTTITRQEEAEAVHKADVSFTPLAMPSLSGPGSIAVVIGMSSTVQESQHIVIGHVLVAIGIAITAVISYAVLRAATRLEKILGATGMNAMARIMGFLLICIGIQFVINGVLDVGRLMRAPP
jgi:multiple antibiotic resistance protein